MPTSKPLLVGITGGIGSGKSTVCEIFTVLGVPVYNSDTRAKQLMNEDSDLILQIKKHFGEEAYLNGQLNRAFMAGHVFSDSSRLEVLNSLVHPAVAKDFAGWVASHAGQSYLLKEAALIFETGTYKSLDATVLVTAPEELRIKRVLARDPHRTGQQVKQIMSRQLPDSQKIPLADYVIDNDETELVTPKVLALHSTLLEKASKRAQLEA